MHTAQLSMKGLGGELVETVFEIAGEKTGGREEKHPAAGHLTHGLDEVTEGVEGVGGVVEGVFPLDVSDAGDVLDGGGALDVLARHVLLGDAFERVGVEVVGDEVGLVGGDAGTHGHVVVGKALLGGYFFDALEEFGDIGREIEGGGKGSSDDGDAIAWRERGLDKFFGGGLDAPEVAEAGVEIIEAEGDESEVRSFGRRWLRGSRRGGGKVVGDGTGRWQLPFHGESRDLLLLSQVEELEIGWFEAGHGSMFVVACNDGNFDEVDLGLEGVWGRRGHVWRTASAHFIGSNHGLRGEPSGENQRKTEQLAKPHGANGTTPVRAAVGGG